MNIQSIYNFADKYDLDFDNAWSELEDVMSENSENIEDLDWNEENTFYVDFLYDWFEANVDDFENRINDFLQDKRVEQEIIKQVG